MELRTFVINLARSKDRRKDIQNHLNNIGLPFEFIEAVDGNNLTQDYIDANFDLDKINKWYHINKYQIALTLSHRNIFEKMIGENIQEALILEDDAIVSEDCVELLKNHQKWIPQDSDVVLLGHRCCSWINHQKVFQINSKYAIGKMYLIAAGAHGYYITNPGALKLLNKMKQRAIRISDDIIGDAVFGGHNLYAVLPPLIDVSTSYEGTYLSPEIGVNKNRVYLQRRTRKLIIDYKLPVKPFIWLQGLLQKLKL